MPFFVVAIQDLIVHWLQEKNIQIMKSCLNKRNMYSSNTSTRDRFVDMKHRSVCLEDSDTVELNHEMFEIDAVIFDELKSRNKTVSKKAKGIEMEYKDFPYLILWSSANHGNFVAIEPWTGLSTCSDEGDWFEEKEMYRV